MSLLLIIMAVVVSVILLVLIIALFVKKEYDVARSIVINKRKQVVFDYIMYLKNQEKYSKWTMRDPAMKIEYTGVDGTAGFKSAWKSADKKVGQGEQQIISVTEGEKVELQLHFIKPFEGLANATMRTEALADTQTRVTWGFQSKMKYPMNIMLLFMNMDNILGNDLQVSLANLKTQLEHKQ